MPAWLNSAVFYEIYPQSFCDSNGDGIGDIPGMISKLQYVADCGFNAIWLNPWFKSAFRDGGYDITDFYSVDERYGSNEDARFFMERCHELGIKVVLDLVVGHTSIDHPWFRESCKLEKNEYSDLYIWCPNVSWRGAEDEPDDYYVSGWSPRGSFKANFFAVQPALNFGYNVVKYDWEMPCDSEIPRRNREVVKNIMRFWLNMGCDGFRVDMARSMIKRDPEYKKTIEFWREMRNMFDNEYPDAVLISEWFNPKYSLEGGFHLDFVNCGTLFRNDDWMSNRFNPRPIVMRPDYEGGLADFLNEYMTLRHQTNGKGYIGFFSGNHDRWRMRHFVPLDSMAVNMAMLFTMPGCPFLYYGDELGMRYIPNVQVEGSGTRGGSRTPMQWKHGKNLGFSDAPAQKLYLPVDSSSDAPTAADALNGKNPLFTAVKELLALHRYSTALWAEASFEVIHGEDDSFPLVYLRTGEKETILVALNPTNRNVQCTLPNGHYSSMWSFNDVFIEDNRIAMSSISAIIAHKIVEK